MRILALEPYHGGSHRAFLDGWCRHSGHTWSVFGLAAHHWKWRMRHAPVTLAEQVNQAVEQQGPWDVVLTNDMLNLAEFRGLVDQSVARLPAVVYFHENQLTYPVRVEDGRDIHFALSNAISALAAEEVWFNSAFHRDSFLEALDRLLRKMPDGSLSGAVERISAKAVVQSPGVELTSSSKERPAGPLRILWAARWEHDKNPDDFFAALKLLEAKGVDFRLSVIGETFRQVPPVFDAAREFFAHRIDRWGYQADREDYLSALREADVVVSTANHEFFGISTVEAITAGARPLLPRRLAYPELLDPLGSEGDCFYYDGSPESLAGELTELVNKLSDSEQWRTATRNAQNAVSRFHWSTRADEMDRRLEQVVHGGDGKSSCANDD